MHGDPAIKLNYFDKPDFEVNSTSIFYNPSYVSTEVDSFTVNVISTNLGRAVSGNFFVELKRTFPDASIVKTYLKQIPATAYKDTIAFKLPVDIDNGVGVNTIQVTLDANNVFDHEISETNNTVTVSLFIKSADIIPIYPSKYAIVPNAGITLKASTGDPFGSSKNYIFQIDTTDNFDSPLAIYQTSHSGGVVSWQLPFALTDSTVYYWRVSLDNAQPNWRESSFQYIANKSGWGQAHFFQFKNDSYQYVTYNRPDRNFVFFNNFITLSVQAGIYPYLPWDESWYKLNGAVMDIWSCLGDQADGIKLAVFNPVSGEPWYSHDTGNHNGPYGNNHCKAYDVAAFDFYTDYPPNSAGFREKITDFINDVPNGYYILAYNHKNHFAQAYEEPLRQAFESFGSNNIRSIQDNTPYIIYGIKGEAGTAHEVSGTNVNQTITLTDSIKTKWNAGYVKSELIGPASKWNSLHWRYKSVNNIATDSVRLAVVGIRSTGVQDTLFHGLAADSLDVYNLSTFIDAHTYPYINLIAFMKDDSMHTPAQMKRWQVLYDGVPETCLNPSAHFYFHKDTVAQGDNIIFSCAIQNIGNYDMVDSLLVAYWIVDKDRNIIPISYPHQRPHPVGDVFIDTITYSTKYLEGLNSLWINVNPNFDQPEQYSINNIGEIPFFVNADKTNPLLDVTFDGVHILDGDIVSADPKIQVVLRDENKFLPVDDTTSFKVFLKKPGMAQPERIYFIKSGAEIISFYPATLPENVSKLEYAPGLMPDGIYELMIQAKDASQNISGKYDYKISYEIINKSTITEVLNYPNPFSTSTRFVFTLTGSEVPTYMKIQIMTISGKIVKEIDMSELGSLHIGRNITQYAWDGNDQFGDRLANGVYLYRVMAKMNDTSIELNQTAASKYFTQQFGKMYLFR